MHITCTQLHLQSMNSSNSHQPWYVDPVSLRLAVSAYPSLQAALFPPPPTTITPAQSQDISVYQLLQVSIFLITYCAAYRNSFTVSGYLCILTATS